jgi:hypothetical protein
MKIEYAVLVWKPQGMWEFYRKDNGVSELIFNVCVKMWSEFNWHRRDSVHTVKNS